MNYKLNVFVAKIIDPVTVVLDGEERYFTSGAELAEQSFPKSYLIESLSIHEGRIVIVLQENNVANIINWCGEEQISFF